MFCTARLQYSGSDNVFTITLADVVNSICQQFGWYNMISATVYGPFVNQSWLIQKEGDDKYHPFL